MQRFSNLRAKRMKEIERKKKEVADAKSVKKAKDKALRDATPRLQA